MQALRLTLRVIKLIETTSHAAQKLHVLASICLYRLKVNVVSLDCINLY